MMLLLKRLPVLLFAAVMITGWSACKKGGGGSGGGGTTDTEENLAISIDPDPGSAIAKALGSTYDFKVNVTSKMPSQGVTIAVTYKKDSDGSVIFSQTISTTSTQTTFTITNIPLNEVGTVNVLVTSKSKASNTASKSFKLVRK